MGLGGQGSDSVKNASIVQLLVEKVFCLTHNKLTLSREKKKTRSSSLMPVRLIKMMTARLLIKFALKALVLWTLQRYQSMETI